MTRRTSARLRRFLETTIGVAAVSVLLLLVPVAAAHADPPPPPPPWSATAAKLTWVWGDGTRSRCLGPGTPYPSGTRDALRPSPDCGHTYRTTSADAPGARFTVSASIEWRVTWTGGGQSGTLPDLATTTSQRWPVEQIQSVIVG